MLIQVLDAVIRRTLEAPGTFDEKGWLRVGLAGHQPALAEGYISTGSLYLCAEAFLPLGPARHRSVLGGSGPADDVGKGMVRDQSSGRSGASRAPPLKP